MIELSWLQQTNKDVPLQDDWLCPAERQRLVQLRVPKRRADWRLGRWTAKCAVASYLRMHADVHSLGSIGVLPSETGAPQIFIDDQPAKLAVSLSHCAGVAICAVAEPDVQLGCDLERIEPRGLSFIQDYFTPDEQAIVSECGGVEQQACATNLIWSAKEAALKATQAGLRSPTQSVSVSFDRNVRDSESWHTLTVHSQSGGDIHGWWRSDQQLVYCFVASPTSALPKELEPNRFN